MEKYKKLEEKVEFTKAVYDCCTTPDCKHIGTEHEIKPKEECEHIRVCTHNPPDDDNPCREKHLCTNCGKEPEYLCRRKNCDGHKISGWCCLKFLACDVETDEQCLACGLSVGTSSGLSNISCKGKNLQGYCHTQKQDHEKCHDFKRVVCPVSTANRICFKPKKIEKLEWDWINDFTALDFREEIVSKINELVDNENNS